MNPSERNKEALLGRSLLNHEDALLASIWRIALNLRPHAQHALTRSPAKTEQLCNAIVDNRNQDPWGGDGYLSTILRAIKMEESSDYAPHGHTRLESAYDYTTSASKELLIREQTAGLVRSVTSSHLPAGD